MGDILQTPQKSIPRGLVDDNIGSGNGLLLGSWQLHT